MARRRRAGRRCCAASAAAAPRRAGAAPRCAGGRPRSRRRVGGSRCGRPYRNNGPLLAFLIRRLLFAVIVLVALTAIDYSLYRLFRPDFYPGDTFLGGVGHDMERVFRPFGFGRACATTPTTI